MGMGDNENIENIKELPLRAMNQILSLCDSWALCPLCHPSWDSGPGGSSNYPHFKVFWPE